MAQSTYSRHVRIFLAERFEETDNILMWPEGARFEGVPMADDDTWAPLVEVRSDGTLVEPGWTASAPVARMGLVIEPAPGGGLWIHCTEDDGGVIRPWIGRMDIHDHEDSAGTVDVGDEVRQAKTYTAIRLAVPGRVISAQCIRLLPREVEGISDLRPTFFPVSPEQEVLRDLILESGPVLQPALLGTKRWRTGHVNPGYCCICRLRFTIYERPIKFTVPPGGAGLFFAAMYRKPFKIDPKWPAERIRITEEQNAAIAVAREEKLRVGETGYVHPECIGLTLDW